MEKQKQKANKEVSKSFKAKQKANNNWKNNQFSITGLHKYVQGDGKKDIEDFIKEINEAKKTNVNIKQLTKKAIIDNLTDKEKTLKNGEPKQLFSLWFVLNVITRLANKEVETNKNK